MKHVLRLSFIVFILLSVHSLKGQTSHPVFTGAEATKMRYKAAYMLDDGEPKKIKETLRNMDNALEDPRLKGKLDIELIVFGDGVAVFEKSNPYEAELLALQKKGVILAQCTNTLKARHIEKDALFPFISFVPSGNGELIIRHDQGWAIIHP